MRAVRAPVLRHGVAGHRGWPPSPALYAFPIVRVLLISPVSGRDPSGGDVAYTEALVARPPDGVTYTTYDEALAEGTLVERGRRPKNGGARGVDALAFGARALEIGLRRSGLMFRESYRYLTPRPGAFDLVHAHVFPVRLIGTDLPLVTSSGFPLPVLYEDRFGWSHRHVVVAAAVERALSRSVGGEPTWFPPRRAARTMVQSIHYRDALVASGADPEAVVVRTLGSDGEPGIPRTARPVTVGFISTVFEEKGGNVVLAAFREVLAEYPDARLVVVGSERPAYDIGLPEGAVTWIGPVSRQRVLDELLADIDVLVHPTRCDSGPPYVILEALQRGVPVVTSDVPWIDEGLTGPGVRRVPADPSPVSRALVELLDPNTFPEASHAAIELWRSRYSMDVLSEQIGRTYREAMAANR